MKIEFELEKANLGMSGVNYIVKRKGLDCGFLFLEEPYELNPITKMIGE